MNPWETPWKAWNHAQRLLSLPMTRACFAAAGVPWGRNWKVFGLPILQRHRGSHIQLGDGLNLRSSPRSNPLTPYGPVVLSTRSAHAILQVGKDCGFTGAVIVAEDSIKIGDRVLLGANAMVLDTDFHPLDPSLRVQRPNDGAHSPIVIEDDAFVGTRAIVLKGVRLGQGCVVGAASVVTKDVPPFTIVAGNPARVIGSVQVAASSPR